MGKSFKKWIAPVIVAVIAIVAIVVLFATGVIGGDKSLAVPDVVNMSVEEAQKILEEAGLSLCITEREINNDIDENTVLKQSPESGEKAAEGSIVNVTVSEKSVVVTIPQVENYDKALAIEILQNAGFKVEIIEKDSEDFADGAVISQDKTGKGETGSVITITVSRNDKAQSTSMTGVPSLEGKTPEEAKALLEGKLYLKIVGEKFSSTIKKGAIISQSPTAGISINENSVVEVVISKGKASDVEIIMPDVIHSSRLQAKEMLEKLGLRVSIKEMYNDEVSAGIVYEQSIPKGETVKANTMVTITVSHGKKPEITTIKPGDLPTHLTTSQKDETTKRNEQDKPTKKPSTTRPSTTKPVVDTEESKYVADFAITTDKSQAKAGDTITVSVKLKTNYKIVAISLPVIYDSTVFEVVGTDENKLSSYLTFKGKLTENGYATNGNWKSPDNMYSKNSNENYWTSGGAKAKYKFAFATWVAMPSQGTILTSLDNGETIVTFKLKVKADVKNTSGKIFLSPDFIKTASDPQGSLSVGRAKSDTLTADAIIATGQTIDLKDATALVTIK